MSTRTERPVDPAPLVERTRLLRGLPTAVAVVTVLVGLADIASVIAPERASRLHSVTTVLPAAVPQGASAATAVAGLLLVMLGQGLRRRKRRAWRIVVGLLALTALAHLAKGLDIGAAIVTLALLVVLLVYSRQFYAEGDPRSRRRAPAVFLGMLLAAYVFGYLLLSVRPHHIYGSPSFGSKMLEITAGLVGIGGPLSFRDDRTADLTFAVLLGFGAITVITTAYLALRPAEPVARLSAADEARLREILERHGERDSLGYFALRRDKSVVFSSTGKSAVSYRVVSGVMLASGDPLGDPEAWPGAIAEFAEIARRHAWVPAVMGCSELGGEVWVREAGLKALELGDEAVIEIADFSLEGRAMRNVRQMVGRVERAGYTTSVRRVRDMTPDQVRDLRRQAAAWRDSETERGFSMALGRYGDGADSDCVTVCAYREERLAAILHFVPWGTDGLSLDLMRRDRSADPGLNELMIVAAAAAAPELGVTKLSLNFAVFRSALERGGRLGAGPVLRAWRGILLLASRWFQIDSLYRFNAKFRPIWEPRFICYPGAGDIPRIALAALEAEAFLVWPRQWLADRYANRRLRRS